MTRQGTGPSSHRLDTRDNVVFVTPNTHPNELSVLFLLFFLCIAVVVLAFIALFCISCRARKTIQQENLEERSLQPQHVAPGSSPHMHVMSIAVAVAMPAPARLKLPKPMTRREEHVLRIRRYESRDLRALHALHALHGHHAEEDGEDHEKARGLTQKGNDRARRHTVAAVRTEG